MPAAAVAHVNLRNGWLDLAWPKEHGSWSLALEPLALGLVAAPSAGGAWLSLAVIGAFFARRPLRLAWVETAPERRTAARVVFGLLAGLSLFAFAAAVLTGGLACLGWLLPSAVGGGVFIFHDVRGTGRTAWAEIAGAAAFACVPAALGILAGRSAAEAAALALLGCGRSLPAVLTVRAVLRGAKSGVRSAGPAVTAAVLAVLVAGLLAGCGIISSFPVAALVLLAIRTTGLLVWPSPILRARTLGMIEAGLGLAFALTVGFALRR